MAAAPDAHYAQCEALLRERDRDLWLACLFAPQPTRRHIHALYAYALETAGVQARVTQPLLGEMRLRWWTDAIEAQGEAADAARAHPVADALIDTIETFSLPRPEFVALADARAFDLYDDPMPTLATLLDYCRATAAAPMRWAARILGAPQSPAFDDAGVALGLTKIMRSSRILRYLPTDIVARHADEAAGQRAALQELREAAADRFARARRDAEGLAAGREALLPAATVPLYLGRLARRGDDLSRAIDDPSPLRRQWRIWRASRGAGL